MTQDIIHIFAFYSFIIEFEVYIFSAYCTFAIIIPRENEGI